MIHNITLDEMPDSIDPIPEGESVDGVEKEEVEPDASTEETADVADETN